MSMNKIHTKLKDNACIVFPPPPSRFTLAEWHLQNKFRNRICFDQQTLADSVNAECERITEEIAERTLTNKLDTDHKLHEKLTDIKFVGDEIRIQRKEVVMEVDALLVYMERIKHSLDNLKQNAEVICKKCLICREGRLGIDLCHDEIEDDLKKEIDVIQGAQNMLRRALEMANEQVRRLRSTIYFMDRDLENKDNVLKIDETNCSLKHTSMHLSMYHGFAPLDSSTITLEEWSLYTQENLDNAAKEINSARQLRSYIEILLTQAIEDLKEQYDLTNAAFTKRIEEIKETKMKLEIQHAEIVRQANEMTRTITRLEISIAEKEGFMALAHTRLGNRCQRAGVELCKDMVELSLSNEVSELRGNLSRLQHMIAEAQASLRYLLKTQIQLEEDINIKTNTLKIDEVDCMTLRQAMDYHAY
ncbi:unnamed protein product [Brassicogethes aeneus]|uniref:Tektin n=1 Tax=Brassicogethes aeneus TaxID=1431903 RepID=A0A9P0B7J2_BRAAE|nr:unnamed protein product [Brassicogethes aeneus]